MPDLPVAQPRKPRYSSTGKSGKQGEYFVEGMVRMLGRVRPAYKNLAPDIQRSIAWLIWKASSKCREHSLYPEAVFFTYQELDQKFGRAQFLRLNSELELFDVFPYDYRGQQTRGYMRSVPKAVASKDMTGITASKWTGAREMTPTPVDRKRLIQLARWLEKQIKDNTEDLFSAVDITSLMYIKEMTQKILALASTDVAGPGFVIHRYVESASGRLYAENINLQTASRLIKQSALHGLWEYDIQNCHYEIFDQMAQRAGYDAQNIKHYLAGKLKTRMGKTR